MAAPLPAATAAPGYSDTTTAVTAVGDKAFVLKEGVWTDTTFDPAVMTTTPLPFPSDLFLEFLGDHPGAGKYFALGEQVIVVIDGVAYETVPGDPADLSEESAGADVIPIPTLPAPDLSSPLPSSSQITLTADVSEGVAPLEVNFSGVLAGESDEVQDYACQIGQFDFGDGNSLSITAAACDPEKGERRDTANYVYDQAGQYQVTYSLGELKSEPLTIVVREAGASLSPTDAPEATAAPTTSTPATAVAVSASATPLPLVDAEPPGRARGNDSIYNVWGFILLPLLGLAVGWFIWGRRRIQ
jgi:PKD repeat protein